MIHGTELAQRSQEAYRSLPAYNRIGERTKITAGQVFPYDASSGRYIVRELKDRSISRIFDPAADLICFFRGVCKQSPSMANALPKEIPALSETLSPSDFEDVAHALSVWMQENTSLFQSIQSLNLANSNLSSLPDEIFLFRNLYYLDLRSNLIVDFPVGIESHPHLLELDLTNNPLSRIPKSISVPSYFFTWDPHKHVLNRFKYSMYFTRLKAKERFEHHIAWAEANSCGEGNRYLMVD